MGEFNKENQNDWKWQLKNRITNTEKLSKIIELSEEEKTEINTCLEHFKMAITPYYAGLMDPKNRNCPIRMQAVPTFNELVKDRFDMCDPLAEDEFTPCENIVKRYPDRVLFLITRKCAMYCRHCTRRRVVGEEDYSVSRKSLEKSIEFIRGDKTIRDVLISGGDPFIADDSYLEYIIKNLREIPHVEIIRIGTRTPVVLPMRITDELMSMLKKYHPIWINTHFNHPKELTPESCRALAKIVDAGIPMGNQSVLLKGVNNDSEILKELYLNLVKNRVRPYYLYQCDLAEGISHFRTNIREGIEIIRQLRGNISGFAVPVFVVDAPGGGGKIPVGPQYIDGFEEDKVVLLNYKGEKYTYPDVI